MKGARIKDMNPPAIDPKSLSVDERLRLIDELWLSIAADAERGDARAVEAINLEYPVDPELLAELERRSDEFERDPSSGVRWEDLREELKRKYG
jgi:putative addiction module component (TIGR02574 family)